jgi:microcystin-dependent protein
MSDPFVAEIRMFAGNFAPTGWALCHGQLMPISQNTALFALIGTYYGGNGQTNFALPNLQDRTPMFWGQGSGLSPRDIGEQSGSSSVTLIQTEMPAHNHQMNANSTAGGLGTPSNTAFGGGGRGRPAFYTNGAANTPMGGTTSVVGASFPHNNRQPYLGLTFIIALQGIFPARN